MTVIVRHDSGRWFAQCLEIDYSVVAKTFDDVTAGYARILAQLIEDHLRAYGHLGHIVRSAPPAVWAAFFDSVSKNSFEVKMDILALRPLPAWVYVEKAA
jgi:hypothetical protein